MRETGIPPLGLAHLTFLHLTPPELVDVAATAGFDFVGVRVQGATLAERQYAMEPGSQLSRETILRLQDSGMYVLDIEFLTLDEHSGRDYWLPALEAGAALGASLVNVVGSDPDQSRLVETLSSLTADAADYGIRPALEPISYQPHHHLPVAAEIARQAGAAILLDTLHLQRIGAKASEIKALDADQVLSVQLCDGPLLAPDYLAVPESLPLGMTADGGVLQVEARALREVPGEGEFPLREFLGLTPSGVPISVEAPNMHHARAMPPAEFAMRNRKAVRSLLERMSEVPARA